MTEKPKKKHNPEFEYLTSLTVEECLERLQGVAQTEASCLNWVKFDFYQLDKTTHSFVISKTKLPSIVQRIQIGRLQWGTAQLTPFTKIQFRGTLTKMNDPNGTYVIVHIEIHPDTYRINGIFWLIGLAFLLCLFSLVNLQYRSCCFVFVIVPYLVHAALMTFVAPMNLANNFKGGMKYHIYRELLE